MNELLQTVFNEHLSTITIAVVGYALKKKIDSLDKVTMLVVEFSNIKEKLDKIEHKLDDVGKFREEFIVLKSEVKSQWKRVDDIRDQLKDANA